MGKLDACGMLSQCLRNCMLNMAEPAPPICTRMDNGRDGGTGKRGEEARMWSPRQVTHVYPLCGIFHFPWHRHQIEGTNGF